MAEGSWSVRARLKWIDWVRAVLKEARALRLVLRDPRTPWYTRWVVTATLLYVVSSSDFIPGFLPILRDIDELFVIPFALWIAIRVVPRDIMADCRTRALILHPP
jgi:uncharacterized membrane protein YkvA (DUF1232 family)